VGKRRYGRYLVETGNEDKVFFPDANLTKGDLIDYYERIAETLLPYLRGRPISMHRFPDGIEGKSFFQKERPEYFPDWIDRVTVGKEGGTVTHVLVENTASLVYIANQACITPHVWLSRKDKPKHPEMILFDLDPADDEFEPVRTAAVRLHEILEEVGLPSFVKTTGSRGLHVAVPLDRSADFEEAREFAQGLAAILVHRHPEALTVEQRKENRNGRLFLDTNRNAYGQTAAAPYAVRARPGAPVAVPLDWDEVSDGVNARSYTVRNIFRRLGQKRDPWKEFRRRARSLRGPWKRMDTMLP